METIRHEGRDIAVRQVARTSHTRLLRCDETGESFLEYPVSVGPYKIDVDGIRVLTSDEVAAIEQGTVDMAALGARWAQEDQASERLERRGVGQDR